MGMDRREGSSTPDPTSDSPPPLQPNDRFGLLYSLSFPNFRLLWLGHASHGAALWMEQIARPWLVLLMTGDNAVHVGGIVAMRTLPQLIFGLWAGVIADRFDRKQVLLITKVCVLALSIIFAVVLVAGRMELWMVYAAAFLRGTFMAFDQPARQSLIGSIVPSHALTNAMALMSSTQNVTRLGGVIASGVIIELLGINGAFIGIALIYTGAVLSTWLLDIPSHRNGRERQSMLESLVEGLRYSMKQPAILSILVMSLFFFSFGMSWMQVFGALFARTVFEIGAIGFSALVAAASVGALAGALLLASTYPRRLGLLLNAAMIAMGGLLALFSLSSYLPGHAGLVVPFLLIPFVGMVQTTYNSTSNALLISIAPVELRGRVISLVSLDRAMMSAGAAFGGILAATAGVQVAQIIYGVVLLCAGVAIFMLAPALRRQRLP